MNNHETRLDAQGHTAPANSGVAKKLQDDARSAPSGSGAKPITEPSDAEIRKLLENPQEFQKLYEKYYSDLYYKTGEQPQPLKWVSKQSLEKVLQNPKIDSDERLVAASSLAAFDHLAHAVGSHITNTDVPVLDGWTGAQYARYMDGASKAKLIDAIETGEMDHPATFGAWLNDTDKSFPEPLGPLAPVLTGCFTGTGIYGAALALGTAPAVGLAVVGGAAAAGVLTGIEYGLSKASDYFHASRTYQSRLKELKNMTQSASLPVVERNITQAY